MNKQTHDTSSRQIGVRDVYERFWACRDFELRNFWQRSIFLGAFLTLSYVGYGTFCLKMLIPMLTAKTFGNCWVVAHLFAIGIVCFGLIVSALWVLMAKGSKMWYEWQEKAIVAFVHGYAPNSAFESRAIKDVSDFGIGWTPAFDKEWADVKKDCRYRSPFGGPFSVSKITICIGQLSLFSWLLLGCAHVLLLMVDQEKACQILEVHGFVWGGLLLSLTVAFILFFLRQHVKSDALSTKHWDLP